MSFIKRYSFIERYFHLKDHNTNLATELTAGLSTFLTMAFILAVNPGILSEAGIDFDSAFIATIGASVLGTLIMGLYARWPVAVAPGMGLNAYFAYIVVLGYGLSWQQGLAAVFVAACAFFIFSASRLRSWLIGSIPSEMGVAITAGIGLFLAMIGLTSAEIIVDNPDTLVGLGDLTQPKILLALSGVVMIAALEKIGVRGGILITILLLSTIGWLTGLAEFSGIMAMPPSSQTMFALDFSALLEPSFLSIVFVMFFVDFFDTTGTLTALSKYGAKYGESETAGMKANANTKSKIMGAKILAPKTLDRAVLADTSASIFGSLLGTSNMTTYLESAAGLRAGGRTGLVAVTIAILFMVCLFFAPLFSSIPVFATAPALIFVAVSFMSGLRAIDWRDMSIALPVLLTMLLMPLTFSIAAGISIGFLSYSLIRILTGKAKDLSAGLYLLTGFGLIWIIVQYLL